MLFWNASLEGFLVEKLCPWTDGAGRVFIGMENEASSIGSFGMLNCLGMLKLCSQCGLETCKYYLLLGPWCEPVELIFLEPTIRL